MDLIVITALVLALVACTERDTCGAMMCRIGPRVGTALRASVRTTVGAAPADDNADPLPEWKAAGTLVGGIVDQSPAWPTHVAGDQGFLIVASTAAVAEPSGWTELDDSPQAQGSSVVLQAFHREAAGSSEAAPLVEIGAGNNLACVIVTVDGASGVDSSVGAVSGASGLSSITFPSTATSGKNRLVLLVAARSLDESGAVLNGGASNGQLANLTTRVDAGTQAGNGGGIVVITGDMVPTGNTGASTVQTTATLYGCLTIAVEP